MTFLIALLLAGNTHSATMPALSASEAETPTPGADLSFDLLPPSAALDTDKIAKQEKAFKLRRTLLQVHLATGIALVATLTVATVLGTLDYDDRFGGGGYTNRYDTWHEGFAIAADGLFVAQATLAWAAPTPFAKPPAWNASMYHRIAMYSASAGMIANSILGPLSVGQYGRITERDYGVAHLVIGFVTYALVISGLVAWIIG